MARGRSGDIRIAARQVPDTLLTKLEGLGLSRNAALGYVTLLEDDGGRGLTGYEVASRSGIPRSAVYAVLRKLCGAGAAFEYGDDPVRFVATTPERWLDQVKAGALNRIDEVGRELTQLPKRARPEPIWILRRYDEVMQRIERMVRGAQESVWLSLWPRELERLGPTLDAIQGRNLHRVLYCPAKPRVLPAGFSCWVDTGGEDGAKVGWSHKALVVVDRSEALIGGAEPTAENHAVCTANPSLVDVATNHIILDITLMARSRGEDCVGVVGPMMRPHLLDGTLAAGTEGASSG